MGHGRRGRGRSRRYFDYPRRRPARQPANGIRSRAQGRQKFGQHWWGDRWIEAVERSVDANRLGRGRSYARGGQVTKLEIGPGHVEALVQGSFPEPYEVDVRLNVLPDAEWDRVFDALAGEAIYAAKLLVGELPEDVEGIFDGPSVPLLPATAGDLLAECTCWDWARPCKHIAAILYLVGERVDEDPFLLFALRGRDRDAVMAALRSRRSPGDGPNGEPAAETPPDRPEPLPTDPAAFWMAGEAAWTLELPVDPPPIEAQPIHFLGTPAFWKSRRKFVPEMEAIYRRLGDAAREVLATDAEQESPTVQ